MVLQSKNLSRDQKAMLYYHISPVHSLHCLGKIIVILIAIIGKLTKLLKFYAIKAISYILSIGIINLSYQKNLTRYVSI